MLYKIYDPYRSLHDNILNVEILETPWADCTANFAFLFSLKRRGKLSFCTPASYKPLMHSCIQSTSKQRGTRPAFCNKTENKTSWKNNKWTIPRPRLFDNQKWNETGTRTILRRKREETLTNFPDFQYFMTRPGLRLLKI